MSYLWNDTEEERAIKMSPRRSKATIEIDQPLIDFLKGDLITNLGIDRALSLILNLCIVIISSSSSFVGKFVL